MIYDIGFMIVDVVSGPLQKSRFAPFVPYSREPRVSLDGSVFPLKTLTYAEAASAGRQNTDCTKHKQNTNSQKHKTNCNCRKTLQ